MYKRGFPKEDFYTYFCRGSVAVRALLRLFEPPEEVVSTFSTLLFAQQLVMFPIQKKWEKEQEGLHWEELENKEIQVVEAILLSALAPCVKEGLVKQEKLRLLSQEESSALKGLIERNREMTDKALEYSIALSEFAQTMGSRGAARL